MKIDRQTGLGLTLRIPFVYHVHVYYIYTYVRTPTYSMCTHKESQTDLGLYSVYTLNVPLTCILHLHMYGLKYTLCTPMKIDRQTWVCTLCILLMYHVHVYTYIHIYTDTYILCVYP